MAIRKIWAARFASFGTTLVHRYTGSTLVGASHMVRVGVTVREDGTNYGRQLSIELRPEDAVLYARSILDAAARADGLNREAGNL